MGRSGISARWWVPVLFVAGGLAGSNWAQKSPKGPPSPKARLERAAVNKFA